MIKVSVIIPTMNRQEGVLRCIDSVLHSEYMNIEVIVVDNASDKGVCDKLTAYKDDRLHIICSDKNLGAGGGRNLGARKAIGEYLLFLDDDNVIDKDMILNLFTFFESSNGKAYVMIGPIMLYLSKPDKIWMRYVEINMYTSQAVSLGNKEDYQNGCEVFETGLLPNCFMVRQKDFNSINGFDEKFIVMYEEADLAFRLKSKFNKKIAVIENSITHHDVEFNASGLTLTCRSPQRAYLTARNRVYFMRKNASVIQMLVFSILFFPLVTGVYLFHLLKEKRYKESYSFLKGSFAGWTI